MHCSTIIVSFNTFSLTRAAVEAALSGAPGLEHEVIIVDNHSADDSAARLREAFPPTSFPHVQILCNSENTGFSRANNQGASRATGEVLFFLNPDTVVHGPAIRTLHDFLMAHPEAGAIGPHLLNADGTDQASASPFITARSLIRHHLPIDAVFRGGAWRRTYVPSTTRPVDVVHGCALALRREVFDEVGGWDESYFLYSEETELCYALVRAGYTNYFVREATITHYGGAGTWERYDEQQVVQQRSVLQFLRRHHGPRLVALNRVIGILGFGTRALVFPVMARCRPDHSSDYQRRAAAAARLFRWFMFDYSGTR